MKASPSRRATRVPPTAPMRAVRPASPDDGAGGTGPTGSACAVGARAPSLATVRTAPSSSRVTRMVHERASEWRTTLVVASRSTRASGSAAQSGTEVSPIVRVAIPAAASREWAPASSVARSGRRYSASTARTSLRASSARARTRRDSAAARGASSASARAAASSDLTATAVRARPKTSCRSRAMRSRSRATARSACMRSRSSWARTEDRMAKDQRVARGRRTSARATGMRTRGAVVPAGASRRRASAVPAATAPVEVRPSRTTRPVLRSGARTHRGPPTTMVSSAARRGGEATPGGSAPTAMAAPATAVTARSARHHRGTGAPSSS